MTKEEGAHFCYTQVKNVSEKDLTVCTV